MATEMISAVEKFALDSIDSPKMDKEAKIPPEVLAGLAALGLCGYCKKPLSPETTHIRNSSGEMN